MDQHDGRPATGLTVCDAVPVKGEVAEIHAGVRGSDPVRLAVRLTEHELLASFASYRLG